MMLCYIPSGKGGHSVNELNVIDAPILTDKQQAFINAFFTCGYNATEAARRAGYSLKAARQSGYDNMKNPDIRAEIERRLTDYAMSANEALARLAFQARGDMGDLFNDAGEFDFKETRRRGLTVLIKKLKRKKTTRGSGENQVTEETIEIEMYDAQTALALLLKQWQLDHERPTENIRLTWYDMIQQARSESDDPFA